MKKLTKEEVKNILAMPNGVDKLIKDADSAFEAAWQLMGEENAAAVGFLCKAAAKKRISDEIERLLSKNDTVMFMAMGSEDAKMRKNTARLIGALKNDGFTPMLIGALEYEEVRFVRPSLLLALGACGDDEAKEYLDSYVVKEPKDESEKKHYEEECEALNKARASLMKIEKHEFLSLDDEYEMELRCPDKLSFALENELEEKGFRVTNRFSNAVRVKSRDYRSLYEARCFFEVLFPIANGISADERALAKHVRAYLEKMLMATHKGSNVFAYRIEIKGENVDRGEKAKKLAKLLDNTTDSGSKDDRTLHLVNSPSNYEVEIRIELHGNGGADAYLKLYTFEDKRFDYRVGALPASMHGATAAAVLRMAKEYLTEGARVLDPCCGSGTLLIEREKLKAVTGTTGVDIAHKAIDIARENAGAAKAKAKFVVNDCLRFEAKRKYDELVSNLPFGNRVGTHKDNEVLYKGILDRLSSWVKKDGIAILYTMEFTLLKKLIKERQNLELLVEARTDAGGLTPMIFVIRVK